MKKCLQCDVEMKFLDNKFCMYINKRPNPPLVNKGDQMPIHTNIYVCPRCGLIQQYIPEDELEYIKEL